MLLRSIALSAALIFSTAASAGSDDDGVAWDDDDIGDLGGMSRGEGGSDDKKRKKGEDSPSADFDFDEPEEEFDLEEAEDAELEDDEPSEMLGDFSSLGGEDDGMMEDFAAEARTKTTRSPGKMPGPIKLQVNGKDAWADNYPLSVVAVDRDAVVVELPVLIAKSRVGNEDGFSIVADIYVGTTQVGHVVQSYTPASLAEFGPTFAFLKVVAPVIDSQGEVRVVVQKAAADGTGVAEAFTRSTPYQLQ